MEAVKKIVEVGKDKSVTVKPLPFKAGSKVEVIVLPAGEKIDIFDRIDNVMNKKKIVPLSLKQLEKIVHEVRGIK